MPVSSRQDFLFQWHITGRCNLRCAHCYETGRSGEEMSPDELLAVAEELADAIQAWSEAYDLAFAPEVSLTGGEPLLRPDLFDLAARLISLGFGASLLTNGTLVDERVAERLAELGLASVQVSLEGPEGMHDHVRGAGSFGRAMAGVRRLVAVGLPVTLNMTLTRLNSPLFEETLGLAQEMGAARLGFSRLVPEGRGSALAADGLTRSELASLYDRIAALDAAALGGVELVTSDPLAWRRLRPEEGVLPDDLPVGGCSAGVSGLTILPDGSLMPCRRLDMPIGNLRRDSLREVWAVSPVLEALRDKRRYGPGCGACRLWAACRGCRAVARAVTGDYLADDPHCFVPLAARS